VRLEKTRFCDVEDVGEVARILRTESRGKRCQSIVRSIDKKEEKLIGRGGCRLSFQR
jgi:hypothetical protein